MQFEAVLEDEEVHALKRFVQTDEAERAIEAKFQIVSLAKVIELGGVEKRISRGTVPDSLLNAVFDRGAWDLETARRVNKATGPTVEYVPKLAVCNPRIAWGEVQVQVSGHGSLRYGGGGGRTEWEQEVRVEAWKNFPRSEYRWRAPLPILPKEARQALDQYPTGLVLWEADWDPTPVPLRDPAILVPIFRDFFAVAYVWDLTELEKKVLSKAFIQR